MKRHITQNKLFKLARLTYQYIYDFNRFRRHSIAVKTAKTKENYRAILTFNYHAIEKGMSLPNPKKGFGKEKIETIIKTAESYENKFGSDFLISTIHSVLRNYSDSIFSEDDTARKIRSYLEKKSNEEENGGTTKITKEVLFLAEKNEAIKFIKSRKSVRIFNGKKIENLELIKIIETAKYAPSVCNRQSCKVFIANDRETIDSALAFQNGNSGFGDKIGALFIVTSDINNFMTTNERNQPFVDGGIFAMSIVSSLHAFGYGSCMLNWSSSPSQDRKLQKKFSIPKNHVIITMIGAGFVPDHPIDVATSPRIPTEKIITWL